MRICPCSKEASVVQQYQPMTVAEIDAGAERHNLRLIGYHDLARLVNPRP